MKKTRRFASLATAAILAACAVVPATMSALPVSAAGSGSIKITDNSGATTSSLEAFQIFTAEVKGTESSVVITDWGNGIDVTKLKTAIANSELKDDFIGVTIEASKASAQKVADVVSTFKGDDAAKAEAFAKIAANCIESSNGTAASSGTITGLDTGYYIIVDTAAASNGSYDAYTLGMLSVVTGEDTAVTVKRDFPTFDKQIGDINDTKEDAYTYNEAADHDMGDNVPFKLIATVPSNVGKYDTYKMIFHDDIQKDVFTLDGNAKVYYYASNSTDVADRVDVTASFAYATSTTADTDKFKEHTDGTEDFTLTCNDIKKISGITVADGGRFEVEYTATLTDKANMGATGNWNGAYLEYSNNPNASGSGDTNNTGKSPTDYVVAFTYQAVVDKLDGVTNAPLAGATFTLEKKLKDGSTKEIAVVKTDAETRFVFNGLDDGDYKLTEIAPTGYNAVDPIEFTISATEVQTDGSEALEAMSATAKNGATFSTGKTYVIDAGKADNTNGAENGSVKTDVINFKGSSLPSTGGIGTTIFYVAGGVLVVGAGVLLITKKRAKDAQ